MSKISYIVSVLTKVASSLDSKGFYSEADEVDRVIAKFSQEEDASELSQKLMPQVKVHREIPLYQLVSVREGGDTDFFFQLDESVYQGLKSAGLMSENSNSNGPFTAKDISVISSVLKSSKEKSVGIDKDVERQIGKELQTTPTSEWGKHSNLDYFKIIKMTYSMFGTEEGEEVGKLYANGDLEIDSEDFGLPEVEFLKGKDSPEYHKEIREVVWNNPGKTYTENKPAFDKIDDKWKGRFDEAASRAYESRYAPDEYEDVVSETEIPYGKEIEQFEDEDTGENPDYYPHQLLRGLINRA